MRPNVFLTLLSGVALASCTEPVSTPLPERSPLRPQAAPVASPRGRLTVIALEAFFARHQAGSVLVYDVRPSFVSAFGRIPGALPWPKGDFEKQWAQRKAEIREAEAAGKVVVLYCTDAACPDARAVAERLTERAHDVSILEGGYAAWKDAGMATE